MVLISSIILKVGNQNVVMFHEYFPMNDTIKSNVFGEDKKDINAQKVLILAKAIYQVYRKSSRKRKYSYWRNGLAISGGKGKDYYCRHFIDHLRLFLMKQLH